MKNKPFVFSLLSFLCLVEPLIKVLYFKASTQFDFVVILANLMARDTFREVIDFWLVFPVAGLLILKLRKWTYFTFLGVLLYINYNIFTYEQYTWPYNSDSPFFYNYAVALLSVAVFVYFLSPAVRAPFFDRRVRWWEPKARFAVNMSCKLQTSNLTFPSQILNLSQGGAFVQDSKFLRPGDMLMLEFNFLGQTIAVPAEVVSRHVTNGTPGYGLRFQFKSLKQSVTMAKVIKVLKKSRHEFKDQEGQAA